MRTIREVPSKPPLDEKQKRGVVAQMTLPCPVITPYFGGGAETRVHDASLPVRATAIRGHLRFWWRATRGSVFASVEALRARESEIWGSTKERSAVEVTVEITEPGREYSPPAEQSYVLFPFREQRESGVPETKGRVGLRFQAVLRYPQPLFEDVAVAAWAWSNFGGVGGRTRRGCGAIHCAKLAPKSAQLDAAVAELRKAVRDIAAIQPAQRAWPTWTGHVYLGSEAVDPMEAWMRSFRLLRRFRQDVEVGRNRGASPQRPGRSRWPEADSLRAITGKGDPRHMTTNTLDGLADAPAFPRAEFGLPIVFHFPRGGDSVLNSTLYPEKGQRMSSPFIVRPLATGDGTRAFPMIVPLHTQALTGVRVEMDHGAVYPFDDNAVCAPDLANYDGSPMAGDPGGSALGAFYRFALRNGFGRFAL